MGFVAGFFRRVAFLAFDFGTKTIKAARLVNEKPFVLKEMNCKIGDRESPETMQDPEKPLQTTSFVIHATRGVIRDQSMRRKTMAVLLIAALVFLIGGSTFLQPALNPHEHPWWFISFWVICAWLAITAILLAIFDMLAIKRDERAAEKQLRQELRSPEESDGNR